jgi:hypothetical protein
MIEIGSETFDVVEADILFANRFGVYEIEAVGCEREVLILVLRVLPRILSK